MSIENIDPAEFDAMVSRSMSEETWLQHVLGLARFYGWRFYHPRPARTNKGWRTLTQGDTGWPDVILVRGNDLLAVELKTERGKVSPEQQEWLTALERVRRVEATVWRPSDRAAARAVLERGLGA